jgi:predicted nucleic acid-binding protein
MVFCNTTPFIALASIDRLNLLHQVLGDIAVAQAVAEECAQGGPISVPCLQRLPWVSLYPDLPSDESMILDLDRGEKQTILLARHHGSDLVVIDERRARSLAEYLGLRVTGTLGILVKAKASGFIPSFREAAAAMRGQGIYYSQGLIDRLGERLGEIGDRLQ